jgi:hypothetical protein
MEGNITVVAKEGQIWNGVFWLGLIMDFYINVYLAARLLMYGDLSYWLKSITIVFM